MLKPQRAAMLIAASMIALSAPAAAQETIEVSSVQQENVVDVSTADRAMNSAILTARKTLPVFWDLYEEYPEQSEAFNLKAGLPTKDNSLEHIWIYDFTRNGDEITGKLQNIPRNLAGGLQQHDTVTFTEADVSDWLIWSEDKRYGGYTIRVIANMVGGQKAANLRAGLHDDPVPHFAN